ncbi:MAG: PTS sugar transporter subunit IIA [Phycisphaerae bacterium]|nr:PTS sugar transporter subunit IIA [Phycisphaerae bacterium]MDD5380100.1 PTS sugar transporter subunit IIA [Phycisphaerae bacterium]
MPRGSNTIQFSSLFGPAEVICQTELTDRDAILQKLLNVLTRKRKIENIQEVYKAIQERENEIPMIVGPGIAMPHARLPEIDKIIVGIATSKKGVVYAKGVNKAVKLIVLIISPKASPAVHLLAVSSVAKICQDPATADIVAELPTPEKVWEFFDRGGVTLPGYVRACDIMKPVRVKLHEYDTLEKAITLFVRHGLQDLPVVDKDNNLVGVVTTYELLRVCLPDYVLWMEDLTPILNFESFAEILHNESKTWLAEIMTNEYATVDADAPAIQVAKEITSRRVNQAYVMRGEKLIGVVSLGEFLGRVLRG